MRSMTGCGHGTARENGWEVTAEIRAVNHRFLDISMRLPRNISFLEQPVRRKISETADRGHFDIALTVQRTEHSGKAITADYDFARLLAETAAQIAEITSVPNDITASLLMKMDGVLSVNDAEMDEEAIGRLCDDAVRSAMDQVVGMRTAEGENLKKDLEEHLRNTEVIRDSIAQRAPLVVQEYREKLLLRLKALEVDQPDPQRIAQEVAMIADRCAIDEELARLQSHIRQMRAYFHAEGPVGKKMDFLIQEMNRECNTIGSKASDVRIAQSVVEMKSEIEKMREQIQNAE